MGFGSNPRFKPTQMAIPLRKESNFLKTVDRCNVACLKALT